VRADPSRTPHALPLPQQEEIDAICQMFEAAWQTSGASPDVLASGATHPALADYLKQGSDRIVRSDLFRELLQIDLAYRGGNATTATLDGYRAEFPELMAVCDSICLAHSPADDNGTSTVTRLESSLVALAGSNRPMAVDSAQGEFADYVLLERIAAGGMGVVDKAWQPGLNRVVALKRMLGGRFSSPEERRRFRIEAESTGRLQHAGIVPVYEVGEHDGQLFFSMGFIDGVSLKTRLAENPLEPREAAELILKVARAVDYAHTQGIIHRDLKPANILIDSRGNPLVTDFGLAKQTESDSGLTATGQVLGTPSYMPPEQAWGESSSIGPASDVYALGATLYCALTGRPPFQAATAVETLSQVLTQDPVPPRQLNPLISVDLETICLKCLRKAREQRYATMSAFADELERFLAGRPILARPVGVAEQLWRWTKRNPLVSRLIISIALLLTLFSTVSTVFYLREAGLVAEKDQLFIEERKQARRANDRANLAQVRAEQAQTFARLAEERRLAETKQRSLADQRKTEAEFHNYVSNIRLAAAKWELNRIGDMRAVLDESRPQAGARDFRSWEWNYLWNLCHSSVRTWQTDRTPVCAIRYSPEGKSVLTGNSGGSAYSWDPWLEGRRGLLSPDGPEGIYCFSPNGIWLAASLVGGQVSIVNTATGAEVFRLAGHAVDPERKRMSRIMTMAFSRDGQFLATGSGDDMTARVYSMERRAEVHVLPVLGDPLGMAFSPDGNLLAVANYVGPELTIWDLQTAKLSRTLIHQKQSLSVDFHPDGTKLVTGGDFGRLMVWDVETGDELVSVDAHREQVQSLCYSPDGRLIASGGSEGILLWDSETGERVQHLKGHAESVSALAFSPDGNWLASGDRAGEVHVWSTVAGISPLSVDTSVNRDAWNGVIEVKPQIRELGFSGDGEQLLTASFRGYWAPRRTSYVTVDSDVQLWDLTSGRLAKSFTSVDLAVTAISPQGDLVLCSQREGSRLLGWDVSQGRWKFAVAAPPPISPLDLFPWLVQADGFHRDGQLFAGRSTEDQLARIWKCETGAEVVRLTGHTGCVLSVAFNRTGDRIVTGCHDGVVRIWRAADGSLEQVLKGHSGIVTSACFSPNGDRVVSASGMSWNGGRGDHSVRTWDASSGKELVAIEGSETPYGQVFFSADGQRVFGSTAVGAIALWDAETGREILMFNPFQEGTIERLPHASTSAMTPDGGQIAVTRGHLVRVLDGRPESQFRVRQVERAARGLIQNVQIGGPLVDRVDSRIQNDAALDEDVRTLTLKRLRTPTTNVTLTSPSGEEIERLSNGDTKNVKSTSSP
jgi:WD40 repeat protein/serine/threonine protein kinase